MNEPSLPSLNEANALPEKVAKTIRATVESLQSGMSPTQVARNFFQASREEGWTDFQLGWALQVAWVARGCQLEGVGTVREGLSDTVIEDLCVEAFVTYHDEEKRERIVDVLTETLPRTAYLNVHRGGKDEKISFEKVERTFNLTSSIDSRLNVLERWGQFLDHYTDANMMGRGALVARMMDLNQVMRNRELYALPGYTQRVHQQAVSDFVPEAQKEEATELTAVTFPIGRLPLGDRLKIEASSDLPGGTIGVINRSRPCS